jgi:hypothetical protein
VMEEVFCPRSVPRYSKQLLLRFGWKVIRKTTVILRQSRSGIALIKARGQFGNTEDKKRPPLEAEDRK